MPTATRLDVMVMSFFEPFLSDVFQVAVAGYPGHWVGVRQFKEPDDAFEFSSNCGFPHRLEWVTRRITEVDIHTHHGECTGRTLRGDAVCWGVLLERD